jgi:hypothetical protein
MSVLMKGRGLGFRFYEGKGFRVWFLGVEERRAPNRAQLVCEKVLARKRALTKVSSRRCTKGGTV